ncbi:MAG: RtcB family protein [Candidatus Omnitrophica bacterium]|nr:RtcB family protein [Candidatus Omnitrophota bacterium]MCF7894369.1 RtcB family protein [Candidatus Omnitrophota bacterium]
MQIINKLEKISEAVWEIPKTYQKGMLVPARFYGTEKIIEAIEGGVLQQIANVATLPGIVKNAICMPDGHRGYGFPIGGVAAMDSEVGVISPGGIGFDINCGMRLLNTNLSYDQVKPYINKLINKLFQKIPAGVGKKGFIKISQSEFRKLVEQGSRWCIDNGFGWPQDLERTEEGGRFPGADSNCVSRKAIERGYRQVGTLGSGNHYLEVQVVKPENIADKELAKQLGIKVPNQVVVMFHCGSRGFGHQIGTDYLQSFLKVMQSKYGMKIRDKELASAPFKSREGQNYYRAMQCAVNMAFANRQVILHRIREVFAEVFNKSAKDLGMNQVYDVAHNTAKLEKHQIEGKTKELLVHRKGATRAYPPGSEDLPSFYKETGQPVIIGGSMETGSYLLVGCSSGKDTFYTTAHGSGRIMSRTKARKKFRGKSLLAKLKEKGIYVNAASLSGLAEEAGGAYKDIDEVAKSIQLAGISKPVAKLVPIGNIKG